MATKHLFSIAPHAPFLPTLVARILDGTLPNPAPSPFGLADLTILVPTRRARLALADAFLARCGPAMLLPDIRTIGDTDDTEEPFLPPFDAPPFPRVATTLARRLTLARLISAWIAAADKAPFSTTGASGFASPPSPAEILGLADSLGTLIDDCEIEKIPPSALRELPVGSLSEHWQESLKFLEIALDTWPQILAECGQIDPSRLRNLRLERQAEIAALVYAGRPVIAAGSTGSIPATARLLGAIAQLPDGALVLPGLDTSMTIETHKSLLNTAAAPHGHPQYGLARLLARLGCGVGEVEELAPAPAPRTQLVRRALALAQDTAHWNETRPTPEQIAAACAGLSILAARSEDEEARAVAVAARAARAELKTVGIVTPDRNLARRIAAELRRFEIDVDDSAGAPLFQSRAGRLVRQAIALVAEDWAPVPLIALMRNRHVTLGRSRAELAGLTDQIELALLRGQRLGHGPDGLRAAIDANLDNRLQYPRLRLTSDQADALRGLIANLEAALAPLSALAKSKAFHAADLAAAIAAAIAALTGAGSPHQAVPEGGDALTKWTQEATILAGDGPVFAAHHLAEAFEGLIAGLSVRVPAPKDSGIAIWGLLEARLLSTDLTILAGVNEGLWPAPADPGPWLSRNMAIAIGLEPEERRQGQMAHDFEMALGGKEVLMTYAERVGANPALPSRLLQRLEAFLGQNAQTQMRDRGAKTLQIARALDNVPVMAPARPPLPSPPASTRPRSLSITEVEKLIRSPFDLYARYVLGLLPLEPLGADPGHRERGTLIHDIFARVMSEANLSDPAALDKLLAIADETFAGLDAAAGRRAIWRRRLRVQGEKFLAFERGREARVAARYMEQSARWELKISGERFELRGRADRIDRLNDGTYEIIDFKTGSVPIPKDMTGFLAPQLLLEAAMVSAGAFTGIPPGPVSALTYLRLPADPTGFELKPFALPAEQSIAATAEALMIHLLGRIETFLFSDTQAMPARILPNLKQNFAGDYDHLARVAEWTAIDGQGEGEEE